jgi:hypothetical protein
LKDISASLSTLFDRLEMSESLLQAATFGKPITFALKKNPLPFGSTSGLAPVILMLEPVFPPVKGYSVDVSSDKVSEVASPSPTGGPKGQAQAQALAQQNAIANVTGITPEPIPLAKYDPLQKISAVESVELINDFSQMLDVLADRCQVRKPKRYGNYYCKIFLIQTC